MTRSTIRRTTLQRGTAARQEDTIRRRMWLQRRRRQVSSSGVEQTGRDALVEPPGRLADQTGIEILAADQPGIAQVASKMCDHLSQIVSKTSAQLSPRASRMSAQG